MNLIPIDETVSTDSEIYSIVRWSDYTSQEEELNKDYKILNEFTKNEYTNLYPVDDKYNHINTLETCDTSHDSYYESILESIKTETELQYELSVAESDYKSVKINKIITFDNIQQIIDG
ncbi:hypothetical protein GmHk_14G041807 [Glycine max]|nr:hypothetical protein GmHk_14G041807 [Glycine max]